MFVTKNTLSFVVDKFDWMHWYDTGGGLVVHQKTRDQKQDDLNLQSSKSHINIAWFYIFFWPFTNMVKQEIFHTHVDDTIVMTSKLWALKVFCLTLLRYSTWSVLNIKDKTLISDDLIELSYPCLHLITKKRNILISGQNLHFWPFFRTWKIWEHYEVLVMRSRGKTHPVEAPTINNVHCTVKQEIMIMIMEKIFTSDFVSEPEKCKRIMRC